MEDWYRFWFLNRNCGHIKTNIICVKKSLIHVSMMRNGIQRGVIIGGGGTGPSSYSTVLRKCMD